MGLRLWAGNRRGPWGNFKKRAKFARPSTIASIRARKADHLGVDSARQYVLKMFS
jgi:hypothetical protein